MMNLSAVREVRIGPIRMGNRQRFVLVAGAGSGADAATGVATAVALRDLALSMRIQFLCRVRRGPGDVVDAAGLLDTVDAIRQEVEVPVAVDVQRPEDVDGLAERVEALFLRADEPTAPSILERIQGSSTPVGLEVAIRDAIVPMEDLLERLGGRAFVLASGPMQPDEVFDVGEIPRMRRVGLPYVLDAPSCWGAPIGEEAEDSIHLARAGAAVGIDGLALTVNGANRSVEEAGIGLDRARDYLLDVLAIDRAVRAGVRYV